MHTEYLRFVVFWAGSSVCLAYLSASLVGRGVIRWGEGAATNVAYLCVMLMFLNLLFLLEYASTLYRDDDEDG